ncbi:MAG: N-acetyltransferase [Phycisphaerae bacterium]|nr:N-acetyltransferase [Phycisphaerae bacterium]
MRIRLATGDDAEDMLGIYAPIVINTHTSFELEPPAVQEFCRRIGEVMRTYPWLVAERNGEIIAYAYATTFRSRPAYRWCAESALYVRPDCHRQGIGRRIYASLFDLLHTQGFQRVVAGIALPNDASVALHESLGFRFVGAFERVGFKLGRWINVGMWQLSLGEEGTPQEPTPLRELPAATTAKYRSR